MNFNGRFYNKPGHLGMTRQQLKDALAGGGGGGTIIEKIGYYADNTALLFYDAGAIVETIDGYGQTFTGVSESDYIRTKTYIETLANALKTGPVCFYAFLHDEDTDIEYYCRYPVQEIKFEPTSEYTLVNDVYNLAGIITITIPETSAEWVQYDGHYYLSVILT